MPQVLRLTLALIAAPLSLTAALTLVAFVIATLSEPTRAGAMAVTEWAAIQFLTVSGLFTATFGLAGAVLLCWLGQHGLFAWVIAGLTASGLLILGLTGLSTGPLSPLELGIAFALGTIIFLLIRAFAGLRADRP